MTAAALPLADPDAVDRLGDDLRAAGYDADTVPELLGAGAHNALGRGHRWPALHVTGRAAADGSALATLVRLFLLGTTEPEAAVAAALPMLRIERGLACGVLERGSEAAPGAGEAPGDSGAHSGDGIRAGLDIRPHADDEQNYLVVSDLDSDVRPGPVRRDHVLGIGAASITLARAVIRDPVGSVLDVGTGCGIQALHCAGHAGSVTATDTNPRALTLAAATARLNGQRWDLRRGSLFEPVAGQRFDLVISNPPFVISPGVRRFEYRDSGLAGDELCRRLVLGLPDHLAPGGTGQLLANWLIHAGTDWRERVGGWLAGTGCDGWVVQREVADPAEYVSLWLADTGETATADAAALAGDWLDYFREQRVVGIGMGLIILRNSGAGSPDVVLDELTAAGDEVSGPEAAGFLARRAWLRGRTDTDLLATRLALSPGDLLEQRALPGGAGWATVLRMLRRPGGPGATVQLDEWGQALLAGCTGAVPLGVQVDLLAAAHRLDPVALAAAVLPAVRTAITRGLLHPVDED